jgi:mannitol/fructose-specific phosphotransferase system IIA component (Ntr-type)
MKIFGNQQYNQSVEKLSMVYINKLLKVFVDKRAKDYQDVKKFVSTQFVDFGFLNDKEVVEMFKTRRKRRKTTEAAA